MAEFDYRIVHRPEKSNVVANALSRLSVANCGTTSGGKSGLEMFQGLEQQYQKDEKTKEILQNIERYPEFCTLLNKLYYTGNDRMQLYIPSG